MLMKSVYFYAAAALLSVSAMTAAPRSLRPFEEQRTATPSATELLRAQEVERLLRPGQSPAPMLVAPANADAVQNIPITLDELVTTPPQGVTSEWSRDCGAYWSMYGKIYSATDTGGAVKIVRQEGSDEVWISNPLALYALNGWLKGTESADGTITVKGAQKIHVENFGVNDPEHYFYMVPMEFRITDADKGTGWFFPSATLEIVYTPQPDGSYEMTADGIYGLCQISAETGNWEWMGYGDYAISLNPFSLTAVQAPEGLETQQWNVKYYGDGHMADVGLHAGKIYIKGLMPSNPDSWTVGTLSNTTATFEVGQYIGVSDDLHYSYLYGGRLRQVYDENYGTYVDVVDPTRTIEFTYDPMTKLLSNCPGITTATAYVADDAPDSDIKVANYIIQPTIQYLVRNPEDGPVPPTEISFVAYDDSYGFGYVDFTFINQDTQGCILPKEDLYYRVYFNNKLFTFYPDEYLVFSEPVVDVPYLLSDMFDFDVSGYSHTFYYYADGLDWVGLQTVYKPADGSPALFSPIVSFPVNNGIAAAEMTQKEVARTEMFDLQGRPVANPVAGALYIVRTTFTDGTSSVTKTINR